MKSLSLKCSCWTDFFFKNIYAISKEISTIQSLRYVDQVDKSIEYLESIMKYLNALNSLKISNYSGGSFKWDSEKILSKFQIVKFIDFVVPPLFFWNSTNTTNIEENAKKKQKTSNNNEPTNEFQKCACLIEIKASKNPENPIRLVDLNYAFENYVSSSECDKFFHICLRKIEDKRSLVRLNSRIQERLKITMIK